jgi:hypothetical protein
VTAPDLGKLRHKGAQSDTPAAKPGEPARVFEIIGSFYVGEFRMEKAVDQDI